MAAAAVTTAISQSAPVPQFHKWMRLCLGSECYNKDAVRSVLHNKFNNPAYHGLPEDPALLFQELKKFQSDLSKLKSKHRITLVQWNLLYPANKQTDSTEFDIPLIVILLEHCTDLPAPVNGWKDSTPPISDQGLSANSLRARSMRHFLYHYGNPMSMDNNEFSTKWTELENIQNGLGCRSVDMLDLKTGPLDPHKLAYFKCATTYLEEGQSKLVELHEETASDVQMLIDEVSTVKESVKNFYNIEASVVKLIVQYTGLTEQMEIDREMIAKNADSVQNNTGNLEQQKVDVKNLATKMENLATKMKNLKSNEDLMLRRIRWNIREGVSNFFGRSDILENIHHHFQSRSTEKDYLAVALSGLGGIGKTEVAAKYVSMYAKADENVIWLECNDLKTSLIRLASYLEIKTDVSDVDVITQRVLNKLKDCKCMFVLNDVVDGKSIKHFMKNLKSMNSTPRVLITSQYCEWDDVRIKHIPMDVFEPDEAMGFLSESLSKCDFVEVETLVHELEFLPLALQQARSYILKHSISIADYVKYFMENRGELLNISLDKTGETEYDKTLLTVWKMAFDKLKEHDNSLAIDILHMMAYMDGSFINIRTFLHMDVHELQLNEAIDALCEYSLIQVNTSKIISMHSLVQKITMLNEEKASLSTEDGYCFLLSKLLTHIAQTQLQVDHDPQDLWFRHMKRIFLFSKCKIVLPAVGKLTSTATTFGDYSFCLYILSTLIYYYKASYYQSRKTEDFGMLLHYASNYATVLTECIDEFEIVLQFVKKFSSEFENELSENNSDQLVWHYQHVKFLIHNQNLKEALEMFDSLPDVELSRGTVENHCVKADILVNLGRSKEALLTNKCIFEWITSRNIVDKYHVEYLIFFPILTRRFLELEDVENAFLCITQMQKLLQELKVEEQSCYWYYWYYSEALFYKYNHQYDECIEDLNRCLSFRFVSKTFGLQVMLGYIQLKRKYFKESVKKLKELLCNPLINQESELSTIYLGAALLCLDEIDEAEKKFKSLKKANYPGSFEYKYLAEIKKYKILQHGLTYHRQIYGDKNRKTLEILQECLRIKAQFRQCYNEVPDCTMLKTPTRF